jgi:thymidine phosphorylase
VRMSRPKAPAQILSPRADKLIFLTLGDAAGRKTIALMSSNDEPLGYAVGNRAELVEAARVLQGEGPTDVKELVRVQVIRHVLLPPITCTHTDSRCVWRQEARMRHDDFAQTLGALVQDFLVRCF